MNIWERILTDLEGKVNPQSYSTWFRPTSLARDEGAKIAVAVPNELFATWLGKNYMNQIRESANAVGREVVEISFVFDEHAQSFPSTSGTPQTPAAKGPPSSPLNPKYTFESFVVSSSNELAHAAALRVADEPAITYNPLYIYGGVGLGKREELFE